MLQALNGRNSSTPKWESKARQKEEALDLVAVLVRFIEGDAE